jgi:hypothetical protein
MSSLFLPPFLLTVLPQRTSPHYLGLGLGALCSTQAGELPENTHAHWPRSKSQLFPCQIVYCRYATCVLLPSLTFFLLKKSTYGSILSTDNAVLN